MFWRGYSIQTMRTCWRYTGIHDCPFHHSDRATFSKPCVPADPTQESMTVHFIILTGLQSPNHAYLLTLHRNPWPSLLSFWWCYSLQTMRTCWHYTGIHDRPFHHSDGATVSKPCVPADTTQESMTVPFIILMELQYPNNAYLLTLHRNPWSPFHHYDGATVSKPCVPADTTQESMTVPFIILTRRQSPNHANLLTLHRNPWLPLSSFWRGYILQTMRTCWHYTGIHDRPFHHSDGATVFKPCTCWHYTGLHDCPFHHSDRAAVSKPCVPADTTQESMNVPFIIRTGLQSPNHAYLLTLHRNPRLSLSSFWRGYSLHTTQESMTVPFIIMTVPFIRNSDGATLSKQCYSPWLSLSSLWRGYNLQTMRTCWHYTGIHDCPFHHSDGTTVSKPCVPADSTQESMTVPFIVLTGLQFPNHAYVLTLHRNPWLSLSSFRRGYCLQTMRTCWHYTGIHDSPFHHSDGATVSKPCVPADTTQESTTVPFIILTGLQSPNHAYLLTLHRNPWPSLLSLWRCYSLQTMRTCWH